MKALEELGIGRPSTYASILSTIVDRGYVSARGTALVPNWIAFSVVRLLEDFFGDLVAYDFTAEMENDLDRIADGEQERVDWLREFYFGARRPPRPALRRRQPRRDRREDDQLDPPVRRHHPPHRQVRAVPRGRSSPASRPSTPRAAS